MKLLIRKSTTSFGAIAAILALVLLAVGLIVAVRAHAIENGGQSGRLLTIHDRGVEKVILSQASTVEAALSEAGITLDKQDAVEPAASEKLVAQEYQINIYRARPVLVVDGSVKQWVTTAYQTADQIVGDVGITLYPEDVTKITRTTDIVADGAGLQLTIDRAVPFQLTLYGKKTEARTQGETVGDMLKEKGINLGKDDQVSTALSATLTQGMDIQVWREGKQTVTTTEVVAFTTQQIRDADRDVSYKAVQTIGKTGSRDVTYEIEIRDGQEVSRTEIASLVTTQSVAQIEVIGTHVALMAGYSADRIAVMSAAGVAESDQGYAAYIIDHENASWCPTRWQGQSSCPASYVALYAENANLGYGLCQATPGNKMAAAGSDWKTNPVTQMKWCASYAVGRYGSWEAAYNFKVSRGWW